MTKNQIEKMKQEFLESVKEEARNPGLKEVKQFFRDIRREMAEIQELKNLRQQKELELMPRAITYDGDKVQVSPDDTMSKICAALVDLDMELGRQIMILTKHQIVAEQMIQKLDDPNERRVMRYYYLTTIEGQLPTWNQVAIRMNYFEGYVKKVHGRALMNLAKIQGAKNAEKGSNKKST